MLEKILLRNVSSYSPNPTVSIAPLKRVSLFYGQNGTGKTTIGNFLQTPTEPRFNFCKIEPLNDNREVLVYNHAFMEKNFHEVSSQPGVFTLNEGNIEAETALKAAEMKIAELSINHDIELQKGINCKSAQDAAYESLLESTWKPKRNFDNSPLAYCFKSLNTRERLLEHVRRIEPAPISDTGASLLLEAAELSETGDQELPNIAPLFFQAHKIEENPILQEVITGSGDSYLSEFIHQLGNSDWVKQALQYRDATDDKCPLCQQRLPENFYNEIHKVFDKTYEQRIDILKKIEAEYKNAADQFYRLSALPEYQTQNILTSTAKLREVLQKNIRTLADKITSPSLIIKLDSTTALLSKLNEDINLEQKKSTRSTKKSRIEKSMKKISNSAFGLGTGELATLPF